MKLNQLDSLRFGWTWPPNYLCTLKTVKSKHSIEKNEGGGDIQQDESMMWASAGLDGSLRSDGERDGLQDQAGQKVRGGVQEDAFDFFIDTTHDIMTYVWHSMTIYIDINQWVWKPTEN